MSPLESKENMNVKSEKNITDEFQYTVYIMLRLQ